MARTPKVVEDRRQQILDAAMAVFAQKGFSRATNKDIAHEAGITPGLIYHYFDSKEAVLKAIIEARSPLRVFRALSSEMLEQPPAIFLRRLVLQILSAVESEDFLQLLRMLLPEILHNPTISPISFDSFQRVLSLLIQYLETKDQRGDLVVEDASMTAHVFVSCMMGFVLRRHILCDALVMRYTHEQIVESVLRVTLEGLLPR